METPSPLFKTRFASLLSYMPTDIHPHATLPRHAKEVLLGQKGSVLWFCGLSGSGKSTIAGALEQVLHDKGRFCVRLDGDNLRTGLNGNLGFTDDDRLIAASRSVPNLKVWDVGSRKPLAMFDLGLGYLADFQLSQDGRYAFFATEEAVFVQPTGR